MSKTPDIESALAFVRENVDADTTEGNMALLAVLDEVTNLRSRLAKVEQERDEARKSTASQIIASLAPVGPLTNSMPSRYLSLVEEYIAKQFSLTDDDIEETFEIEWNRRRYRQDREDALRDALARVENAEQERDERLTPLEVAVGNAGLRDEVVRLREALEQVLEISSDREAFVMQGPRAFATAERIAREALATQPKTMRSEDNND